MKQSPCVLCVYHLPLYHEREFLFHGEVRVNLNGVIFILQLQQLLPALLCYQLAVIDDVCVGKQQFDACLRRTCRIWGAGNLL